MEHFRDYLSEGERVGRRYALRLPRQTPRGAAGLALGQRAGSSLEFKDYRDYQLGDDLRHIDWNAFARTDQLSVKLYREEITPHLDLVLDVSRSMALEGTAKERTTLALAACLATAAANAGFGHAVWLMGDDIRPLPGGNAPPALWGELELSHRGSSAAALTRGTPAWWPRGVRVLLSDLLWVGEPLLAVRPFTEGASAAAVIQLLAEADINPPEESALRLIDAETEQMREIYVDAILARRYREGLARHQQNWHQACRASGAIFSTVVAETLLRDWKLDELIAAELLRVT
ncbi:MAG TPA: DUF58 domain-containing protein [Gemmataceae bacterium]|nr:DUF58 domain-containing protein [Gemmataceae bacterium]